MWVILWFEGRKRDLVQTTANSTERDFTKKGRQETGLLLQGEGRNIHVRGQGRIVLAGSPARGGRRKKEETTIISAKVLFSPRSSFVLPSINQ